ncbi:MAG: hypothetical protein LUP95_07660 [Euryarchaeota archaeon]|nr:hypothetical protein [Euryarchaeota archaeon]
MQSHAADTLDHLAGYVGYPDNWPGVKLPRYAFEELRISRREETPKGTQRDFLGLWGGNASQQGCLAQFPLDGGPVSAVLISPGTGA